jgi:AmmeMemoRadiSam system protein B
MNIRKPYRAGSFYQADPHLCRQEAQALLRQVVLPADLPAVVHGGLAPHAGWVFSGAVAAVTLSALARCGRLERVVMFGADHWGLAAGSVYDQGAWQTPLGQVSIDEELAGELLASCPLLRSDPQAHLREHSLEVQLPLMQALTEASRLRIVPILVRPDGDAAEIGRQVGRLLRRKFPQAGLVGSTDLTHYGPQYGFIPAGAGPEGLKWADRNDRRLLELAQAMQADQIVPQADRHHNACGAGAVAATVAACAEMGAAAGLLLQYATSAEIMLRVYHATSDDAVGYAAMVFA